MFLKKASLDVSFEDDHGFRMTRKEGGSCSKASRWTLASVCVCARACTHSYRFAHLGGEGEKQ